jgi:hypothetical protein
MAKPLSLILLVCAVVLIPLKIIPAFDQDNWLSIALILPVLLSLAASFYRFTPRKL